MNNLHEDSVNGKAVDRIYCFMSNNNFSQRSLRMSAQPAHSIWEKRFFPLIIPFIITCYYM